MEQKKIKRINELYKKQKTVGLTLEEKLEQKKLRKEYIELFKRNLRQTMDNIMIKNEDGSITPLKRK
ncbi:DUF896 domain-containing protein [Defluviitalea phaphyphila]|uniref:DUF896 domain-containing protein n=1 Tax=Defluviitalea phaphyphila TaxID=1473580 RepID=UPI0007303AAF|nr:DUF896 domain-containing protein [Defluviitalea phaphyphila]